MLSSRRIGSLSSVASTDVSSILSGTTDQIHQPSRDIEVFRRYRKGCEPPPSRGNAYLNANKENGGCNYTDVFTVKQ